MERNEGRYRNTLALYDVRVPPPLHRFAGNMERQQADNLLKSHSSGTYLIRERTAEAERFAISIK